MTSTTRAALFPAPLALPCVLLVAACSTIEPPAPPPASVTTTLPSGGVYKGTLGSGDATLLMLFDGTAYLFHADANGGGLAGVAIAANGSQTSDGRFTSASALDYRIGEAPPSPVSFTANFAHAPAVEGAITRADGGESRIFRASAAPMLDTAPTLANAGGLYSGRGMSLGGSTTTRITVAADGYAAGTTSAGCIFKGTVRPRPGVNAYAVTVTFGPAPCPLPDATVEGSGIVDGARLMVALPSPDRSNVFLFDGRK
ncbi:hypothetical protein P9239_22065 [Caballeronia sp. LZ062]|uniref:hypothetical protein n=1 Tax=unclassified Caballeronia TaxID=2646786 RepID=UPI002858B884|nr:MULTISPECIES: hypothetical protein [unclassified Caballeronia]MDR5856369.1 hypothetical protein [Caballeronia sp. LZ050]MDR5873039.1 hypothetical protein [Caballeronia sp. LZ062]